jgi:hypothetical protein
MEKTLSADLRHYPYLYGAYCPETGEQFSMILPYASGECMTVFIEEFSSQFPDYRVIMVMDNAAWHGSSITKKQKILYPYFSLRIRRNSILPNISGIISEKVDFLRTELFGR